MKDTVRQYGRLAAMGLLLALLPGRGVGGDEPPPAELEAQIARLGGTAATTRLDAARALARLGSTAATAAPALRAALRDPDPDVRSESALALLRIGTSPDSLTAWRAGLADADERVRVLCAEGLRRDPEHSAPLRPDALTHDQADPGLAGLAPARDQARPTAVRAQITRALRDRDPHVRAAAVRALAGPWAEAEELPLWELLHALDDAVASVRVAAVDAVAKLRSGWVDAGASIRAALSEPDPTLRRPRTLLYRQYLLRGRTLAPHLESLAKSGSTSERALALALFSTLTNDDRVLWEPVAECAGAREVSLRLEAMLALQRIHIYADWGPDLLLKALADPDSRVRQAAAVACRRWMFRWPELARYQVAHPWGASPQEEQAAAAVFHGMEHPEQVCAAALVQFLFAAGVCRSERSREIVSLGTPALAPVLSGLSRQAPAVRAAAAELLGDLLETYPWRQEEALPALIAALSAPEAEVRRAAAESLARILSPRPPLHRRSSSTRPPTGGDPAPAGVPDGAETILRAALADPAVAVRAAVALALSAQRPADVSLAPELARVVRLHENEGGGLLAEVLETLDPATSESLLQDLAAGAPLGAGAAQECAAAWARRPSPAPTLLRIVCRSVRSPGTLTRRAALRGLECDEADLRDLWPDLAVRLFDRDAEARGLATGLLGGRTESTEFAMTELAEVAGGSDQAAAVAAIRALARLGSRARVTLPGVRAAALS
ncbi:MAG: HEAT repeat domain-containing protein, partial [Planctomycetes bacterium]|nr:HEAT repeat domain-containing protein [Planctomycetota bacterium]